MLEKPFHIIILDEATSNLDLDLEKNVKTYLNNIKAKTSLVIAHRLNLIRDKDRIIVLKNGKLIESGTHSELINKMNEYSKIFAFNKQFYLG
jgi:ATP-binding cassette subfamily B protein